MTPIIRSATPADIRELARLRWQLYAEQEPNDEPSEAYVERLTAFAVDALSRDDRRAWVAEGDGRPVAAMWLQTVPRVPAPWCGGSSPERASTRMG